jgi:predicted DsbA family dithiol-disulfide isomerase
MSQKISRAAIFDALNNYAVHGSDSTLMAMRAVKAIELDGRRAQISIALSETYRERESDIRNRLGAVLQDAILKQKRNKKPVQSL